MLLCLTMPSYSQLLTRRRDASSSLVLLIVSAGFSLATLDLFIVNVALPKIAHDFGSAGLGDLSWVLNAYAIVFAALLVVFGRLSDRFPREYGFLLGVAVFTAASALCAVANSTLVLVIFRIVQAAGAALMTPTSLSMVLATSSGKARDNNVRAWTAISGLMAALGPVVGGLLVAISWRWVFVVNIPFGVAVLVFGWMRLPHVRGERIPYPNALGAALVTAGVALLTLGLVKGDDWGWGSTQTIGVLVGSVAVIGAFVLHCLRDSNPLLDRDLFRRRSFTGASVVSTLYSVAFGGFLLSLVLWDQNVWHWSALHTGSRDRARPAAGPANRAAARRTPDRPPRLGPRDRDRRDPLRRRCGVVRPVRRAKSGLLRRHVPRPSHGRCRRRPDAANDDGERHLRASPRELRDRLGRGQHAPTGRSDDRRGGSRRGARNAQ